MNNSLEEVLYGMQFRRLLDREFDPLRNEYGLQKIDMQILGYLYKAGERNTSKDIMELGMFTKGHISQSLKRLSKKKLIRMVRDKKDRRCVHILLEEEACGIVQEIRGIEERIQETVLRGVTEEEKKALDSVAEKIRQNIRNQN